MVDDERHLSAMTRDFLVAKAFEVKLVHSSEKGLVAFRDSDFDLCILDIKMPIMDGYTLATEIRAIDPGIPIIFLTGKTEIEDRVKGLRLGADDYITKPFSLEELQLRIQNILKRAGAGSRRPGHQIFTIGQWQFNASTRELVRDEMQITLSTTESQLLRLFCEDPAGMLRRDQALRKIWGDEFNLHGRSLNVYVSKLRKYFRDDENIEILNVHGVGYRVIVK